ncbi:MAG TPA: GIY-YIG nuclease family protein [Dongiaceae bacterium]|nr:GIY-YIG nuclease family protein [Dongiaceae bacterium]
MGLHLASKPRGTLYVGVTNDLARRAAEHREGAVPGFTKTYNVRCWRISRNMRASWTRSSARSG